MSDFQSERQIKKTRKDHKCFGCCENIPKGTKAFYITDVENGKFGAYYLCEQCREYIDRSPFERGDSFSEGDLGSVRRQEENI